MENLCWLIGLMAWLVQVAQAGEKRQGLSVRWQPSKSVEAGIGTCWLLADYHEKKSPSGAHFQQLASKPQQELRERFNFYSWPF